MSGLELVARSDCSGAMCLVGIRRARIPKAVEVSRSGGSVATFAHERAKRRASTKTDPGRPYGKCTPVSQASGSAVCETQQDRQGETRLHSMVGHMGFASRTDSPPPRG